jgi:DNA-binding response OmpR family regulator
MSRAQKKVLVIEDDREVAGLIVEELVDRGYDVSVAYDGQEGWSTIVETEPDLVLSDLIMPVMSGLDILERLTAEARRFRTTRFIFLTGLSNRESQLRAMQLGADDLMIKPIDFDLLHTMISARLAGVARTAVWPE